MAQTVHDDLGQSLTAASIELTNLYGRLPQKSDDLRQTVKSCLDHLSDCLQTVQRIATEFRPRLLDDVGFVPAVRWQAQRFTNQTGIPCELILNFDRQGLETEKSVVLFRILQEALTNVARHADANQVRISLDRTAREMIFRVEDDGRGITRAQVKGLKSLGILGMTESVIPWDGRVSITGARNKGTTIKVTFPYRTKKEAQTIT